MLSYELWRWRVVRRRGFHVCPPFVDDVSHALKGAPWPASPDASSHTVPSGATCGSEPLSSRPARGVSAIRGVDQSECDPSGRASA